MLWRMDCFFCQTLSPRFSKVPRWDNMNSWTDLQEISSKFNNTQTAMMKTIICSDIQFLKTTVGHIGPIPILETMIQGSVPCCSNQFLWASDLPISVWIPLLLSIILLLCLCQTYYYGEVPEMYSLQRDNFNNHFVDLYNLKMDCRGHRVINLFHWIMPGLFTSFAYCKRPCVRIRRQCFSLVHDIVSIRNLVYIQAQKKRGCQRYD